eukprot:scaffold241299_cov26-Tisochrysis_lutea.AAC.3
MLRFLRLRGRRRSDQTAILQIGASVLLIRNLLPSLSSHIGLRGGNEEAGGGEASQSEVEKVL